MPETVQSAQMKPQNFLGPNLLAVFVQSIETGVIMNQASRVFMSSWRRESRLVRAVVVFACLVAFTQTCFAFHEMYDVNVVHFGNWLYAIVPSNYDKLQPILTQLQAAPVQMFLIWRCYRILGRRWYIIVPLVALLLGACVSNILLTFQTFSYLFEFLDLLPPVEITESIPYSAYFIAAITVTALLDLSLTGILTVFLWRSKGEVYSERFRLAIDWLIIFLWESAIPPAACACATVLTYGLDIKQSNWDLMFQAALGKLYVISFFVTLNARESMRRRSLSPETLDISNMSFRTPIEWNIAEHGLSPQPPALNIDPAWVTGVAVPDPPTRKRRFL